MKRSLVVSVSGSVALLMLAITVYATLATPGRRADPFKESHSAVSASYGIGVESVGSGGGEASSGSYGLTAAIGDAATGEAASASYQIAAGSMRTSLASSTATMCLEPAIDYPTGNGPYSICTADLNNDAHPDLAVANYNDGYVSVLLSNGDGTFAEASHYVAGAMPTSIVAARLNPDEFTDLAVCIRGGEAVAVFLNRGDGTFAANTHYFVDFDPFTMTAADLDDDGDVDLAVAQLGQVGVLWNDGYSVFEYEFICNTPSGSRCISSADFDGDEDIDLAVTFTGQNAIGLIMNDGDGTFSAAVNQLVMEEPVFVLCEELNGDNHVDLIVSEHDPQGLWSVSVYFNNGSGTPPMFSIADYNGIADSASSFAIADVNGDGRMDIAATLPNEDEVVVVRNNGDGTFQSAVHLPVGNKPLSICSDDFNSDGAWDLGLADYDDDSISIVLNCIPMTPPCFCPYQGDYDTDGYLTALDLGSMIDVLFAGKPDITDPNCPTSRMDFDSDGFATALDLGELIDHLFAGGDGPRDPCG